MIDLPETSAGESKLTTTTNADRSSTVPSEMDEGVENLAINFDLMYQPKAIPSDRLGITIRYEPSLRPVACE
jgi:hypothetical protein